MKLNRQNKLIIGLCTAAAILIVKLFSIQILNDEYKRDALNNSMVYRTIYPTRGIIHDRNGEILVGNKVAYDLLARVAIYLSEELCTAIAARVVALLWWKFGSVVLIDECILHVLLLVHLLDGALDAIVVYQSAAIPEYYVVILEAYNMLGICLHKALCTLWYRVALALLTRWRRRTCCNGC